MDCPLCGLKLIQGERTKGHPGGTFCALNGAIEFNATWEFAATVMEMSKAQKDTRTFTTAGSMTRDASPSEEPVRSSVTETKIVKNRGH